MLADGMAHLNTTNAGSKLVGCEKNKSESSIGTTLKDTC